MIIISNNKINQEGNILVLLNNFKKDFIPFFMKDAIRLEIIPTNINIMLENSIY